MRICGEQAGVQRGPLSLFLSLLLIFLVLGHSSPWAQSTLLSPPDSESVPCFETFEFAIQVAELPGNLFGRFASASFSNSGRDFAVDGFFDGGDTWRFRFMPDRPGQWTFSWALLGENGFGTFTCVPNSNPESHGHVRRDTAHPRYLIHDDGAAHYWYGASWIGGNRYGPRSKEGEENPKFVSDVDFLSYFDLIAKHRHNGMLLEVQYFPLEDDGLAWDLEWIHRGEELVRQMAQRNIQCHISLFGTWARGKGKWFKAETKGRDQVLNVWDDQGDERKRQYIRTVVARFAGFPNVYWELGNEMGHAPNSARSFVRQANEKYIPWLREFDPYDLAIGLSEDDVWKANVDIEFSHQTNELPEPVDRRPRIMNELVRGGIDNLKMWKDETLRNPKARLGYRRTFWRMFTLGGCGSIEASLVRFGVAMPPNEAMLLVLQDQARLRDFIETIPSHINEMNALNRVVQKGPGEATVRGKEGDCYVVYYLLDGAGQSVPSGETVLRIPEGTYDAVWYSPARGEYGQPVELQSRKGKARLQYPSFVEDLAFRITRKNAPR